MNELQRTVYRVNDNQQLQFRSTHADTHLEDPPARPSANNPSFSTVDYSDARESSISASNITAGATFRP